MQYLYLHIRAEFIVWLGFLVQKFSLKSSLNYRVQSGLFCEILNYTIDSTLYIRIMIYCILMYECIWIDIWLYRSCLTYRKIYSIHFWITFAVFLMCYNNVHFKFRLYLIFMNLNEICILIFSRINHIIFILQFGAC